MRLIERMMGAEAATATVRTWTGGTFAEGTFGEMSAAAGRIAAGLRARGVEKGSSVGCLLTNSFESCASVLGVWLAGGVVASLPIPARGMVPGEYELQIDGLCELVGAELLIAEERYLALLADSEHPLHVRSASYERLDSGRRIEFDPPDGDEIAFVQYSSGSTSAPKGCAISMQAIDDQVGLLSDTLESDPGSDSVVTWLPLSHDMGLFGGLMPAWRDGVSCTISSPERFLVSPRSWFDDCAAFGATATVAPPSALAVAARAARTAPPANSFPLRVCIVGAERIALGAINDAVDALGPYGLSYESLLPAYGLAEATLAVSMKRLSDAPRYVRVDAQALLDGSVDLLPTDRSAGTPVVSVGAPLAGVAIDIDASDGVGEIVVRTPTAASGYVGDRERTKATFTGAGIRTGDLGFIDDGELFVIGRLDDMLCVGGRNLYASEVEARLGATPGVRSGNCVLVDVPSEHGGGSSSLVLLAEPSRDATDFSALAEILGTMVVRQTGARVNECVFVPRGSLPKTPSGKAQRFKCRGLATASAGNLLARVELSKATQ